MEHDNFEKLLKAILFQLKACNFRLTEIRDLMTDVFTDGDGDDDDLIFHAHDSPYVDGSTAQGDSHKR